MNNFFPRASICLAVALVLSHCGPSKREAESIPEESAIRELIDSYVAAFEQDDAAALANHWAADAVYQSQAGGEIAGREAIEKSMAEQFAVSSNAGLNVSLTSIEVTDEQSITGEGIVSVFVPGGPPEYNRYSAEFVKEGSDWKIKSITETDDLTDATVAPDQTGAMNSLAWMTGTWIDRGADSTVYYYCDWTPDGEFLSRSYAIATDKGIRGSGYEIIGWDEETSKFRSRIYDGSGAVIAAEWSGTDEDGTWVRKSSGTLADGRKAESVQTIRKIDDGSFGIRIEKQLLDGQAVPDIDEVIVKKVELEN